MGSKNDEETLFTVTAHDSSSLVSWHQMACYAHHSPVIHIVLNARIVQELIVKKEEKGTWQLSVFSRNWIVNKTGLTLQYRAPEGFFKFVSLQTSSFRIYMRMVPEVPSFGLYLQGHRSTDVYVHHPKSVISLFPHDQVHTMYI